MTMTEVQKELTYLKDKSQYSKSPQIKTFQLLFLMDLDLFVFTLDISISIIDYFDEFFMNNKLT